jgi:hypothetical protein
MVKFDLPMVVKRKLTLSLSKTPGEDRIRITCQHFYETGTVRDRELAERPSKITEEEVNEVHDVCESELQSSIRAIAIACSISRTTADRIRTEYL